MSTATTQTAFTCQRDGCTAEYAKHEAEHGYFCSSRCYYQAKGGELVHQVERRSQFCATCYGRVRDIQPLPESVTVADGLQYPTPLTTHGIDVFNEQPRIEGTRISCKCGAVDPGSTTAELQQIYPKTVRSNLFRALAWLAEREAIAGPPDVERYAAALGERWHDAAYAAGRAVYGGEG